MASGTGRRRANPSALVLTLFEVSLDTLNGVQRRLSRRITTPSQAAETQSCPVVYHPLVRNKAEIFWPTSRPWALLPLWLAGALFCCAPDEPEPLRLAVVNRQLTWELVSEDVTVSPLSIDWDFSEPTGHGWQLPGGRSASVNDGALVATGTGRVVLLSPPDSAIDGELHHWLNWVSRTENVSHVLISWRGAEQPFSPSRTTSPLPVDPASDGRAEWQTSTLPLSSLRGVRDAADASEGLEQLKLTFVGEPDAAVRVELDRVSCLSDFDQLQDDVLRRHALQRRGERRHGVVLRAGRTATLSVLAREGDRLRLALASLGTENALDVTLRETGGQLEPQHWSVVPGAPWRDIAIDLPGGPGQALQLELRCAASGSDDPSQRAALLVGGTLHLSPRPDVHPNVLLYVEDTLRRDRLSTYGHERLTDPTLAAIAADGAVFENALAASSWTRPSISSILTSLSPLTHGNRTHLERVSDQVTTLAEAFAGAGYVTASFVTNYHGGLWSGLDQGFDVAREPTADGASHLTSTLTSAAIAESLQRLLEEHADERLFVHVHTLDPHEPYRPEPEDLQAMGFFGPPEDIEDPQRYEAEIHHNDRQLGALDEALKALQLADRTVLAFTSDHGEAFGEHGLQGHRRSLHGEELDVPWVLRWPGHIAPGQRLDVATSHVDMAPTLLGLADVEVPISWQGRDLSTRVLAPQAGSLAGQPAGESTSDRGSPGGLPTADHPRLAHCVYGDDQPDRPDEVAVIRGDGRGAQYKLVAALDDEGQLTPRALYRLDQDPSEQRDLLPAALADHRSGRLPDDADPTEANSGSNVPADPELAEILRSLSTWLADAVAHDLAQGSQAPADPMDPATREWMVAMGYLGG